MHILAELAIRLTIGMSSESRTACFGLHHIVMLVVLFKTLHHVGKGLDGCSLPSHVGLGEGLALIDAAQGCVLLLLVRDEILDKFAEFAGIGDALEDSSGTILDTPWQAHLVPVGEVHGGLLSPHF